MNIQQNGFLKKFPFTTVALILIGLALPFILSDFRLALVGKYMCYAILAIGLDLLWGYTGILSLGHGVYFALGGYAMGMYLKLQNEPLPDFMSWSGLEQLPWFWMPFQNLGFTIFMIVLVPIVFSILIGYPAFRSGIKGVYFTILTQALALSLSILFVGQQPYTGGTNGITNFTSIAGFSLYARGTKVGLFLITLLVLIGVYALVKWLITTKTGRLLVAIRDGENRLKYLGYNPVWFKVTVFAVSAGIAGIAGALFVPQVGIISPSAMGILPSVEIAIWVAIGGRGTLKGAVIGAFLVNIAKTVLSENFPDIWWYFFGGLFIIVVLVFPKGIVGLFDKFKSGKWSYSRIIKSIKEKLNKVNGV